MFENQPKGLFALALANTGERFGYYTMLAVFALFLRANFGLEAATAGQIYSTFLALVYFLPLIGGILADKIGYGKCVTIGIMVMFLAVCLGALYMINNIEDKELGISLRRSLLICFCGFLLMLVLVLIQFITMEGFAVDAEGVVLMEKGKYFHNLIQT